METGLRSRCVALCLALVCARFSACDDLGAGSAGAHAPRAKSIAPAAQVVPDQTSARPTVVAAAPAPSAPTAEAGWTRVDAPSLIARASQPGRRGLLLNVWASWCGSCREEIPMLLQLQAAFQTAGIDFAFVSADEPASLPAAAALLREWKVPGPSLAVQGSLGPFKRGLNPRWHGGIPVTFLFDSAGKLRHFWEGPMLEEEIAPILQGFLSGDAIDGETRTAAEPPQ
jgi:thiol-disulfide isomerase/thioredoxin